jgi:hypothetical protein
LSQKFVPTGFDVPTGLAGEVVTLAKLEAKHNRRDHAAWTSSIEHIKRTPGFENREWPRPMTLEANLAELQEHERDFERREGFTYTVLVDDEVVGCVYVYPIPDRPGAASVRSWVSARHAALDVVLYRLVGDWLRTSWPFEHIDYAGRDQLDAG